MKITTGILAILLSSCLLFACGGSKDDKKDDDKSEKDEAKDDDKKSEDKADKKGDTDTASKAKKKLPGNFGALLAGNSKKKVNDTMKGTGLGLGNILGGMGSGSGMAGSADSKKAPVAEPVSKPPASPDSPPAAPATPPAAPPAAPVAGADASDCDKVASHLIDLSLAEAGDQIPAEYKAQMEAMMSEAKAEIAKMCATQFTPEIKKCILQSKTIDGMTKCEEMFMAAGGGGHDMGDDDMYDDDDYYDEPAAKPVGAAPKWDGKDNSCSAVGDHMGKLMMWMYSGDAATAAEMEPMLKEMIPQFVEMCDAGNWPEAARLCILNAQGEDDFDDCGDMLGM